MLIWLLLVVATESRGQLVTDYQTLISNLRATGAVVTPAGQIVQPFFSVKGRIVKVLGEDVQVFQYADQKTADAQAAQVSPKGTSVGGSAISWVATPHFYKRSKVVVVYVGDNEKVLKLLIEALGEQFAGQD